MLSSVTALLLAAHLAVGPTEAAPPQAETPASTPVPVPPEGPLAPGEAPAPEPREEPRVPAPAPDAPAPDAPAPDAPAPEAASPAPPPAPPASPRAQPPRRAAAPTGPVTLAAPGFQTVNVAPELATFLNDHFAQQLTLGGLRVITGREIGALVGLERQKQLLGCSDAESECVAEIANALGADGLVTGNVGRFGTDTFQVNTRILGPDGKPLTVSSARVQGETAVLDELSRAAREAATELQSRLRPEAPTEGAERPGVSTSPVEPPPSRPVASWSIPTPNLILGAAGVSGGALLGVTGIVLLAGGQTGGGLLAVGGGAALALGGLYALESGRQASEAEAKRQRPPATVQLLLPSPLERAQAELPPVHPRLTLAVPLP